MTANDDLDRVIAGWLETEAQSHVRADGLVRVLDITRRRRPRTSWLAARGSRRVGGPRVTDRTVPAPRLRGLHLRWSMVAVLLLALAILGGAILAVGSIPPRPGPLGETGRLAYVLDGVLFLADWDGRNAVRVDGASMSGGSCEAIFMDGRMWSPDGRHLAYRTGFPTGCTPTVHIVDAQGRAVSSWSGMDGRKVEWARTRNGS